MENTKQGKTRKTVVFMGYACNNNCSFCCHSERRKRVADEPASKIKKKILEARNAGSTYLELIGGEPTIRKDIFEIVRFAKKLGYETIMFASNGRMFSNLEFTKKIIDSGVNHVVFSIHGHNAKLHDYLTKAPGSFGQLMKGIENLKGIGFRNIGSNTTIVKQNFRYLPRIGEMIISLGIRNSEFIFIDPTHGIPENDFDIIVPTYEEVSPYVNELLRIGEDSSIKHWHVRYYPLCFVDEKYHHRISELHEKESFDTIHLAPDFTNRNVAENRKSVSRAKLPSCEACRHDSVCEGFWKAYLKKRKVEEYNADVVHLMLTSKCNMNCRYCYVKKKDEDMSIDTLRKSIDFVFMLSTGKTKIALFGGEPLLRKGLFKFAVDYIKEKNDSTGKGIGIICSTNGALIDDEYIEMFRKNKIEVSLSFDGDMESHSKNRPCSEEAHRKIIGNFKKLKENACIVDVTATVAPNCAKNVFKNFKFIYNMGCRKIRLRPASGVLWERKDVDDYLKGLREIGDFYVEQFQKGNKFRFELFEYYFDNNKVTPCSKGKNLTILPNGILIPCYGFLLHPEGIGKHIIGDVFKGIDFSLRKGYINKSEENISTICRSSFERDLDACYRYCLFMGDRKFEENAVKNVLYREVMERKISNDVLNSIRGNRGSE